MSRGGSYGGGQSSLGYLFGDDEQQSAPTQHQQLPRAQGQNSGNFITDRPSTKVKSVPGGDSSLGYLFGEK
ncbi:hypothetical protein V6Z11_A08G134700 [Gossypium hirsutum]